MNHQSDATFAAALPFLGSGVALVAMLAIGMVSLASTMMSMAQSL